MLKPFDALVIREDLVMSRNDVTSPIIRTMRSAMSATGSQSSHAWLFWTCALGLPLLLMFSIAAQPWIAPGDLLRDPLAVAEMKTDCCKVYFGAVSNLGVLIWSSATAVCLFAAAMIIGVTGFTRNAIFLLTAGLFTGFLALDDLFLIHENVLPALGVSQPATYAAYALVAFGYLAVSYRQILQHRYLLFFVAGGLLATSVMIDWLIESEHVARILFEDGAKIAGISAWAVFHIEAAAQILKDQLTSPKALNSLRPTGDPVLDAS